MPSSFRVALFALATIVAAVSLTPVQAAVRPPKLPYQMTTLPNGLRVILSEDHSSECSADQSIPLCTVQHKRLRLPLLV